MNCDQVRLLMMDYIEEELSLEVIETINSHLENCPECTKEYQEMKEILSGVQNISGNLETDNENRETLKESLIREQRIRTAGSPFLSSLHRKKEEMKLRILRCPKKTG